MSTIPQQLIEIAERAVKSGAKTGKECAAFTRKHAPKLAENHISHLFLAFKMVKKASQFAPAIEQAKAGAAGTLAQLAKPYQGTHATARNTPAVRKGYEMGGYEVPARKVAKHPAHGAPYGVDADLANALGLGDAEPRKGRQRTVVTVNPTRGFKPPNINPEVYEQFARMVRKGRE